MCAPLAPPRLSEPRNVEADAQAVETSSGTERPEARIFVFKEATSWSLTSSVFTAGIGSCQNSVSFGNTGRIEAQREVGSQHRRQMLLRLVERVRNDRPCTLGRQLLRTARALRQLPFVLEQVLEEVVAPLRR